MVQFIMKNKQHNIIKICLIFLFFVFKHVECRAQNTVTFKIDMREPIESGLFSPRENDHVIIRGSFNHWSGNDYILEDVNKDSVYEQIFNIDTDSGSAPEFKYLIIKSNGQELWENRPNKSNLPYGNRFIESNTRAIDTFDSDKYNFGLIGREVIFTENEIQNDFIQFRNTLETQHCCLYEYTSKQELDRLFDLQYQMLDQPMTPIEFYKILTPVTAKIGCGHTAVWMPEEFWGIGKNHLFPLKIHFIENHAVSAGSYGNSSMIERGSIIQEIDGVPISEIIHEMQMNYSADAMNIHFINSQIERRFPLIYARRFGFQDKFQIKYIPPGKKKNRLKALNATSISAVKSVVFKNFHHPPLQIKMLDRNTAVIKIPTFIYYDRVPYFTHFIDSCFTVINTQGVRNLILDLRGNDGGDPFCAAPLFSYLQHKSVPYFSEPYGKYSELAKPLLLPENHYTGHLYTLIDGRCFSTNGHFCALLKYHHIGKFVGTKSGATYKCNAGKNTEIHLSHTKIMLNFGRSTYSAAVTGMDKTKPIMPDYPVKETCQDFLDGKDVFIDKVIELIQLDDS